jgi:hypothetical protein
MSSQNMGGLGSYYQSPFISQQPSSQMQMQQQYDQYVADHNQGHNLSGPLSLESWLQQQMSNTGQNLQQRPKNQSQQNSQYNQSSQPYNQNQQQYTGVNRGQPPIVGRDASNQPIYEEQKGDEYYRGGRVTRPRHHQSNFDMQRAMQILALLSREMA